MRKFKVVFHLENENKVCGILTNISNLITDIGMENLEILMATYGNAVKVFIQETSEFGPLLKDLSQKNVEFSACADAMYNCGIKRTALLDFVTIDFSNGANISKKKADGWSYISP